MVKIIGLPKATPIIKQDRTFNTSMEYPHQAMKASVRSPYQAGKSGIILSSPTAVLGGKQEPM